MRSDIDSNSNVEAQVDIEKYVGIQPQDPYVRFNEHMPFEATNKVSHEIAPLK